MVKLDTEINIDLAGFFRWWGRELGALLPTRLRKIIDESSGLLVVEPKVDRLEISYETRTQSQYLGEFELNDLGRSKFLELVNNRQEIGSAEVLIRLPREYVVDKQIFVPEAAAKNLQQVIGYELDRYTPFKADQVYFDFVVEGKDKVNNQIKLLLLAAPKEKLNKLLEGIQNWGFTPALVDCEQTPRGLDKKNRQYNLLPEQYRHKKNQMPNIIMLATMVLMLLFAGSALVFPLWLEFQIVEELTGQSRKAERLAIKVDDTKKKVDELYEVTNELINNKQNVPSLVEMLDSLSKLMEDDTWLTKLKYSDNKLEIHGRSPTASVLISTFEKNAMFKNTKFISPVNQDKKTGLEWFQISTDITTGGGNGKQAD